MDRDVNPKKLTRRHAVTLLGAGAIVPLGGFKAPSSSAFSTTNKAREDLYYTSLTEVGRRIRSGDLSPVDLTQLMLDRIAKFDPRLKSYATVMSEQALADAKAARQEIGAGRYRGAASRRSARDQGSLLHQGRPHHGRDCRSQEFYSDLRWHSCHQITNCRRRCAGEIEPFRRSRRRVQPVFRCSSQPVAGGPMAGHVVERVRGSYCGRLVFRRHRDRYRFDENSAMCSLRSAHRTPIHRLTAPSP
jgi:hypothetical protein